MSRRAGELAIVGVLIALGLWLRVVHVGTPSLWWDELVEIRTAEEPLAVVLREVRTGISAGAGNAGAMPVDYALLSMYLHATARPAPEQLEAYFRTPACVASIVTVAALYLVGRRLFGRATGALAALLLATSLPAILYAAEARSYSLLALGTVLDLAAFAGVVRRPDGVARWLVHLIVSALYFLTGVFALLVIGVQYLVLGVWALRRRATRPRSWMVLASGCLLGGLVLRYMLSTSYDVAYPRNAVVEPLAVTWASLDFFAADARTLVAVFLVAIPLAILAGRRRGVEPVAWAMGLAFSALPVIALVIRWKHYYFHPRHVLFLLPLFHLVAAAGTVELVRRLDPLRRVIPRASTRRAVEGLLVGALALVVVVPGVRTFLATPHAYFAHTKTLRDLGPLTRQVATTVAQLEPGTRYLLLAERDSTANAVLSAYLDWYHLTSRVTLRSPGVPLDRIEPLLRASDGDPTPLQLRPAHGLFFGFRRLLRLEQPIGDVPARVARVGIVGYTTPQTGADVRRWVNVSLREPTAITPSPPRP